MLSTSSEASVKVDKATSHLLIEPDWTMNLEICDAVNSNQWQAKDVIKSVKKRLQHKEPKVQFLALTLLETMIKNCGDFVHFQVAESEILQDMIKIVRKKTDIQVRNKILFLLDSWQEAFGGTNGKYPQYYWAYMELKKSGVHFPQRSSDSAPIFTPPVTHLAPTHPPVWFGMPSNSSMRLDEVMASDMGILSLSELDSIRRVKELLTDMLQAVNSNNRGAVKDEVIVDLISQCRSNQKKIIHIVSSTRDEELLAQALELNDDLQFLIATHDAISSGSPLPTKASKFILESIMPSALEAKKKQVEDEEEEDGFAELSRRNVKITVDHSLDSSVNNNKEEASNAGDVTAASTSTSNAGVSIPASGNELALTDVPAPVSTSAKSKEQDMIDLLSLTLSANPSPPYTPATPTSSSSLASVSAEAEEYPQNPLKSTEFPQDPQVSQNTQLPNESQSHPVNQVYTTTSNYIAAPWSQQMSQQTPQQPTWQAQPQYQQYTSAYPPPPWVTSSSPDANDSPSTIYQQFTPYGATTGNYTQPLHASRPLMTQGPFSLGANTYFTPRQLQQKSSIELNGSEPLASATASKPFIPSYRLFEDLVDLRSADRGLKAKGTASSSSSSSSQSMISGKKSNPG